MKMPRAPPKEREAGNGEYSPIQIAEPKREKRAAVTAAYRRGYADALEDMRKRQREKKRRRQYFIIQKLNGIALLAFTALAVYILEGDATIAIFAIRCAASV